jgi:hypothetical protein
VQLLMAMKQREPRIVGQEIDFDRFAARNDDYIFEGATFLFSCSTMIPSPLLRI